MWRAADEIMDDLRSGDPDRIAVALETLEFHMETLEPVAVAPLTADLLAPFGTRLPDDVATRFTRLCDQYNAFEPASSRADMEREVALAAARHGPSSLALEASLMLKTAANPEMSVARALDAIASRGVRPDEIEHARDFVSYLLAGSPPVREATVEALARWRVSPDLRAVIRQVEGELEVDERDRVVN